MNSLERRIERAERFAGVKEEEPLVLIMQPTYEGAVIPQFAEPVNQWATFQKALDEARRMRLPCVFVADVQKYCEEYELRNGLQPGTLSQHELCGKVPFVELLEAATGRAQTPAGVSNMRADGADGIRQNQTE